MKTYTNLAADGTDLPIDAPGHIAVRIDHPMLSAPIIVTAHRSPPVNYKAAQKWCEKVTLLGRQWRAPTPEEAFFIPDRTIYPAYDKRHFPDCEGEYIWTNQVDAEDPSEPSGYAWVVALHYGDSGRSYQGAQIHARAVCAGQF